MSVSGLIFNIQKFSLHDGPGIRTTVFLKGCPLDCWWCHNVESQRCGKEPLLRVDRCSGCGGCVVSCPEGAIALVDGKSATDLGTCVRCGVCQVYCPQNGRSICGQEMSVEAVVAEVLKDRVFYERSGGGVSFSGGETLAQLDFLVAALTACKAAGLNTVVDTSGAVPWASFERVLPLTDLFLYDLKLMDDTAHRTYTGVSNRGLLENLRQLSEATDAIWIRFPAIPGVNDGAENIRQTIEFLQTIRFRQVNLLPYHELGKSKAAQLGRAYRMEGVIPPSAERVEELRAQFAAAGFTAVTGG